MPRITREPIWLLPHRKKSGLFLTQDGYVADVKPDDGGRIVRRYGKDRGRAIHLFEGLLTGLAQQTEDRDNPPVTTFLTDAFLPTQKRLKSYRFSLCRIQAVVRFLDTRYPGIRLSKIRKRHGGDLLDFYGEAAPKTRNDNLAKLKQGLDYAVDMELLAANPLSRCRPLRVDNRRLQVPSMDQFRELVSFPVHDERCSDVPRIVLLLGLTGLRPANVLGLHWDEVQDATIRIPPEKMKNGRWGIIPVSAHVAGLLQRRGRDGYVFPSPYTGLPRTHIRRTWARMTAGPGLEWMQVYDLRHFFASQLAKQGANEQQIGRLLCHVSGSVTSRYVHQDIEDLRGFVDELGRRYVAARGEQV